MSVNPYQSPLADDYVPKDATLRDLPRVDGDCLVVASETVLPRVCVRTNEPVSDADMLQKGFSWCPPWVIFLVLLSPLLLIVAYFVVRRNCSLTFGLHPTVRRKYRKRILLKSVALVVTFFAIPLAAATDSMPLVVAVTGLFLAALFAMFFGNSPLSIAAYQKKMFWIKGFSSEFLAGFQARTLPANTTIA